MIGQIVATCPLCGGPILTGEPITFSDLGDGRVEMVHRFRTTCDQERAAQFQAIGQGERLS